MSGCGCRYGRLEPQRGALLARERDLSVAIRSAMRDGDTVVAERLGVQLAEVRSHLGVGGGGIPALSSEDLARIPSYRRPGSVEVRLASVRPGTVKTQHPYAEVEPIGDAELAAFSFGPAGLSDRIALTERQVRGLFRASMRGLGPERLEGRMRDLDRFLSLYRRVGRSIGAAGHGAHAGLDPRVQRLEAELRTIISSEEIPDWYMVLTGRLLPMYVQEGAESASFGYLRAGYGS